jgi:hypothetical protein
MGMEQTVVFPSGKVPPFWAISELLSRRSFPLQMRMIDGELALPDEVPAESWRELRLGTPQGMVTVRREKDRVSCITFGNADAELVQAWNAITWAFAAAGEGQVQAAADKQSAASFHHAADLPASVKQADGGKP